MADIFVSYSHEDRASAKAFVDLLEKQGWSVWWDRAISPGASFSKVIELELSLAKCVIVLWTKHSVASDWVQAEAASALERKVLIPVQMEEIIVPLVFRQTHTSYLLGWPQKRDHSELEKLVSAISEVISKPVLETPKQGAGRSKKITLILLVLMAGIAVTYFKFGHKSFSLPVPIPPPVTVEKPIASIAIYPFRNMVNDITFEVAESLARSPLLQASVLKEKSVTPETGYSLRAIQLGNQLSVTMKDNKSQTTRFEFQVNLEQNTAFETARLIHHRVAREFGQETEHSEFTIPNDIYIEYLTARAELRDSQTPENLQTTIESLETLTQDFPRFTEAEASLCSAYLSLHDKSGSVSDFERAEKHCFRASRLATNNPWVDIAIARMYKAGGQLVEASSSYESALIHSPFLTEALRGLAQVRAEQGDLDAAVAILEKAQNIESGNWRNYQILGLVYFGEGKFTEAVIEYEHALERVDNKPLLLNDLGAAYFMLGDVPGAIRNWKASVEIEPNYSALSNLGSAYYFNRQFNEALKTYLAAIAISDQDYTLWLNAGEAAFHAKEDFSEYYLQAIRLAESQLMINPDNAEALAGLAVCHSSIGNTARARSYLNQALIGAADDIYVLYFIAVTYSRLEDIPLRDQAIKKMISKGYSPILVESDANFD